MLLLYTTVIWGSVQFSVARISILCCPDVCMVRDKCEKGGNGGAEKDKSELRPKEDKSEEG